jgi:conjugal transfer/entry exclusion protein
VLAFIDCATNLSKSCSQKWGKVAQKLPKLKKVAPKIQEVAPKIQKVASFVATLLLINNTK